MTRAKISTRVVAPLSEPGIIPPVERLRPVVWVEGAEQVIAMDRIAAVERRSLGRVGNVAPHRDEIVSALDLLFTGY